MHTSPLKSTHFDLAAFLQLENFCMFSSPGMTFVFEDVFAGFIESVRHKHISVLKVMEFFIKQAFFFRIFNNFIVYNSTPIHFKISSRHTFQPAIFQTRFAYSLTVSMAVPVNILQPLHPHIRNPEPDTCRSFRHMNERTVYQF